MRALFDSTQLDNTETAVPAEETAAYTKAQAAEDYKKWKKANRAYHNGAAIMPDATFDRLTKKLLPFYPGLDKQVGAVPDTKAPHATARKVHLEIPMAGLDKCYAEDLSRVLKRWTGSPRFIISEKVDGYSLQYRCDNKGNKSLFTRGKKGVAQDVSHLVKPMIAAGLLGGIERGQTIRFELVMPRGSLKGGDETDPEVERNAIASIVNARTPNLNVLKKAYAVALAYLEPHFPPSRAFKKLKQQGWKVPKWQEATIKELTDKKLTTLYESWKERSRYEIDGIVIAEDVAEKPTLSNPKKSFAYKVNKAGQKTEVTNVVWEVSRYGTLKPVVEIRPVMIDGVKVTRATAHNAKYVVDNKLGPGAEIEIIRSGGVIPYIVEVHRKAAKAALPKAGTYEWDATKVNINSIDEDHEEAANAKQITTFFSKIGVVGFGPALGKLVGHLDIHAVIALDSDDWDELGAGPSNASKMPGAIADAIRNTNIPTLMAYSGVFGAGFGESSAKDLWELVSKNRPKDKKELRKKLSALKGWSATSGKDVAKNWKRWAKWFNRLPVKPQKKAVKVSKGPLTGSVFVFTQVRDKQMEADITNAGGTIAGSVTKATTHVIYADGETSVKRTKAEGMGITTIPYSKARKRLKL
jgi:DNA ligase (NAD+)